MDTAVLALRISFGTGPLKRLVRDLDLGLAEINLTRGSCQPPTSLFLSAVARNRRVIATVVRSNSQPIRPRCSNIYSSFRPRARENANRFVIAISRRLTAPSRRYAALSRVDPPRRARIGARGTGDRWGGGTQPSRGCISPAYIRYIPWRNHPGA